MPALPWIRVAEAEANLPCVVMASRLPLHSHARIPAFLRATQRIRRQLATADGLIGYSLDAKPLSKTFWTLSAWKDQRSLDQFARSEPHRDLVAAIRPHMKPTTFATWTASGAEVPVPWETARQRINGKAGDR